MKNDTPDLIITDLPESAFHTFEQILFHEFCPEGAVNYRGMMPTSLRGHPVMRKGMRKVMRGEGFREGWKKGATEHRGVVYLLETLFARQAARHLGM